MKLEQLKGKKILILGYGREGKATEKYLRAKLPEAIIGIADATLDSNYLFKQKEFDIAIKTPGVLEKLVTIPYTTATNIFFANVDAITVGVTGSKGKSTTAALIHHILTSSGRRSHLVGNIGNPMLAELLLPYNPEDIFVCELSSYQTERLQNSPHISVITSLFPEHMDYHGSVSSYYQAKRQIIAHAKADDYFIYNPSYIQLHKWALEAPCKVVAINTKHTIQNSQLLGEHNNTNALLAGAVASVLGTPDRAIESAISSFKSLPHRLEHVGTFRGISFYDDAISTAPESTIAALAALSPVSTLIVGGEDRGFDFTELVNSIIDHKIPNLILFPTSGEKIAEMLKKKSEVTVTILKTSSMEEAVRFGYKHSPPGTICLLSTASPSYNLWKNFEAKGDEFKKWVKELG